MSNECRSRPQSLIPHPSSLIPPLCLAPTPVLRWHRSHIPLSQGDESMVATAAVQEDLNPFRIAKQQFNKAADYLELDASTRHVLSSAKRQLIVSIPVKMDGGEVQVFEGYRVQ